MTLGRSCARARPLTFRDRISILLRLAAARMPKQSERLTSPRERLNHKPFFSPGKWQQLMLCVIKCVSDALRVCGSAPDTHLATFPSPSHGNHLGCVFAELRSSAARHLHILLREGNLPSRHPMAATSLTAAVVVNKQQAPSVPRHYCCRATRAPNTDDAQTLPTPAGAVKPLHSESELTVQPMQIRGCSLCLAALLPHISPPLPHPPSLPPSPLLAPSPPLS